MGLDQHFVVADAEPLIALSRLGELELLQQLLGEVWITSVVRQELLDAGSFQGQTEIMYPEHGCMTRVSRYRLARPPSRHRSRRSQQYLLGRAASQKPSHYR